MVVTFRPFTLQEYNRFEEWSIGNYAQALISSGTESEKDALCAAAEEYEELLPDGMNTPGNTFLQVQNENGKVVGYVWYADTEASEVFLTDFGVEPDYRRQGYGFAILRKLEEKLAAEGAVRIRLHVFDNNTPAIRLYQKAGYAVYDHCEPASTYMQKEIGT